MEITHHCNSLSTRGCSLCQYVRCAFIFVPILVWLLSASLLYAPFSLYPSKTILFSSGLLTWLPLLLTHKEATSASEYNIAFGLELIMIVSLSLSRQTDITYHCSVSCLCCRAKYLTLCGDHSLQYAPALIYYYAGARQSCILLAKSLCIHIKRVHMAGNAAKRKMRNLNWRKTLSIVKKAKRKKMYSAQVEVNWTLVQAEKWDTFWIRKLKLHFF